MEINFGTLTAFELRLSETVLDQQLSQLEWRLLRTLYIVLDTCLFNVRFELSDHIRPTIYLTYQ